MPRERFVRCRVEKIDSPPVGASALASARDQLLPGALPWSEIRQQHQRCGDTSMAMVAAAKVQGLVQPLSPQAYAGVEVASTALEPITALLGSYSRAV